MHSKNFNLEHLWTQRRWCNSLSAILSNSLSAILRLGFRVQGSGFRVFCLGLRNYWFRWKISAQVWGLGVTLQNILSFGVRSGQAKKQQLKRKSEIYWRIKIGIHSAVQSSWWLWQSFCWWFQQMTEDLCLFWYSQAVIPLHPDSVRPVQDRLSLWRSLQFSWLFLSWDWANCQGVATRLQSCRMFSGC